VKYQVRLSGRAAKDLDRLEHEIQVRIVKRLDQLAEDPFEGRLSGALANHGNLRKSRVGGWRIIFSVNRQNVTIEAVTIERRGQVYQRI
jgi:mRNA interferase RelE/StbE